MVINFVKINYLYIHSTWFRVYNLSIFQLTAEGNNTICNTNMEILFSIVKILEVLQDFTYIMRGESFLNLVGLH